MSLISQDLPRWSKTYISLVKNHQISTFGKLLPTSPHDRSFWQVQKGQILIHFSEFHENRDCRGGMQVPPIAPMRSPLCEFPRLRWEDATTELLDVGKVLLGRMIKAQMPLGNPHMPPAAFNCGAPFPPAPAAQRAPAARQSTKHLLRMTS